MKLDNILFIHIPRTGGTHFEKLLGFKGHNKPPRCGSRDYPVNREQIMGWDKDLRIMLQHATYSEIIDNNLSFPEENLTKVSIVRDPYQRTVSLYNYFGGFTKWGDFEKFLEILATSIHQNYFYLPQYKYLFRDGELAIKNIIRFEHYEKDMKKFSDEQNLNLKVTFDSRMQKEKKEKNLKKYYANPEHAKMVEIVYARDFELFGYPRLYSEWDAVAEAEDTWE